MLRIFQCLSAAAKAIRAGRSQPALVVLVFATIAGEAVAAAQASANGAGICDQAASVAAATHDVPPDVLLALARLEPHSNSVLQESHSTIRPGLMTKVEPFAPTDEASDTLPGFRERSLHIGCFHLRYETHKPAFADVHEMRDPFKNADYAARFLIALHRQFGSWPAAAGAFHAQTPHHARQNAQRFIRLQAQRHGADDTAEHFQMADPTQLRSAKADPGTFSLVPLMGMRQQDIGN